MCVFGHTWSRDKDGSNIIKSAIACFFTEAELWPIRVSHCGNTHVRFSTFLDPVTLTLTRWPSYTNLTRIPWWYTGCANMNFLRRGFRSLSSDRHTNRHYRNYTQRHFLPCLRVVDNITTGFKNLQLWTGCVKLKGRTPFTREALVLAPTDTCIDAIKNYVPLLLRIHWQNMSNKLSPHSLWHRGTVNSRFVSLLNPPRCVSRICWGRTLDQTDLAPCSGNAPTNPKPDFELAHHWEMESAFQ